MNGRSYGVVVFMVTVANRPTRNITGGTAGGHKR